MALFCHICGAKLPARLDRRAAIRERKILSLMFAAVMFAIFYTVPFSLNPVLNRFSNSIGLPYKSGPYGGILTEIITFSWLLFLAMFVAVNSYQAFWAATGYDRDGKLRNRGKALATGVCPFLPSVTVVVPAFNEEEHLERTLSTCLNQAYRNLAEVIVIDDGSTDRTAEIALDFASRDARVKYFKNISNHGKPFSLNQGFARSSSELTFFMDGDSYLELNAVELLVNHFKDPKVAMAASLIAVDNNRSLLAKMQEIEYFFTQIVARYCQAMEKTVVICPGAGTMVRTAVARKTHHSARTVTEDADFTLNVMREWKIVQEPDAVSYTSVPTTWKSWNNQRKRWLYGFLQTIILHKWAARKKMWIMWAWLGYLMSPLPAASLCLLPVIFWTFGPRSLVYFAGYMIVAGFFAWAVHAMPILWHPMPRKHLAFLIPAYILYQQYLNLVQIYCVFARALKTGVDVTYGPKKIHAL